MGLTLEEHAIVEQASQGGLLDHQAAPTYLPAWICSLLSFGLALPTLGFSLILIPILWVAQHDHTAGRIAKLKQQLEGGNEAAAGMPTIGQA